MDTGVCEVTLRLRGKMKCMQKHDDTDLAVIETRVSDARQMDGTHKFQEWECRGLAKTLGVEVPDDAVWNTTMSGSIAIRENFADILKYIDGKKGGVKYYLCYSIERFTRGGPAVYEMMKEELRKRGVQIRDVQGVIQPYKDSMENLGFRYAWSQYSPSETNELVEAGRGRSNKRDMLTRMIGKEILNANEGYAVHSAPDGYVNDTESYFEDGKRKKRTIRHHDSERASFYEEMFRLRAEGQKTDDEIVQTINARGFRTKVRNRWNKDCSQRIGTTGGLPLTVKLLQTKIQQLSYAGVNCEEWTHWKPVKAKLARTPNFRHRSCNYSLEWLQYEKASHRSRSEGADYQPHQERRRLCRASSKGPRHLRSHHIRMDIEEGGRTTHTLGDHPPQEGKSAAVDVGGRSDTEAVGNPKKEMIHTSEAAKTLRAREFGVSRCMLYYKPKKPDRDWQLKCRIEEVLREHHSYGSRRIAWHLRLNRKRVKRVMNIFSIKPYRRRGRKWKKTRNIKVKYQNLLLTNHPLYENHIWATDFTYLPFQGKFVYVATVIDLYTRKVVGLSVYTTHAVQLTLSAFLSAIHA